MHLLNVPVHTTHQPVSEFRQGVPVELTRPLEDVEKSWTFWSSSAHRYNEKVKPSFFVNFLFNFL